MQSEEALRAGAVACFANAQELYEEAKLLYEHAQSPRSIVLALIGSEEFAKAVVYTVAALLPEQRHLLPAKLGYHPLKHQICAIADGAVCACEEGWAVEGTTPIGRLSDLFRMLVRMGLASLLDKNKAEKYHKKLQREYKEHNQDLRQLNPKYEGFFDGFTESDLKEAALYAELEESGEVNSPSTRVSEHHVVTSINVLSYFLEQYTALPAVMENDQLWCDFAQRVRNGLLDRPEAGG